MKWQYLTLLALVPLAGCSRPAPLPLQRLKAPNGVTELALWHEEAAGTLDSSMLLTIGTPNAPFSQHDVKAGLKRGREIESYWTAGGQPVLLARDLDGWVLSNSRTPSLVICGLPRRICEKELPPSSIRRITLGTYHSDESEPFQEQRVPGGKRSPQSSSS
jgi:hypothetical protein